MRADQFLYVFWMGMLKEYLWYYWPFIYLFTGFPVTIYSTIELSDSVVVLGQPLKIWGIIQEALSNEIKVTQAVNFDQETEKEKNDQIGTQATDWVTQPGSGETKFLYHGSLLAVKPITELWFPL